MPIWDMNEPFDYLLKVSAALRKLCCALREEALFVILRVIITKHNGVVVAQRN